LTRKQLIVSSHNEGIRATLSILEILVNEMSKIFTHKEFICELKETQGFYFCLVHAEGQKKLLYQTKYFGSAQGARSAAIGFIEHYDTHIKSKQKKSRAQRPKPKQEKSKTERSKLKEVRRMAPIPKPTDKKNRAQRTEPKQKITSTERTKLREERSKTPSSKPEKEKSRTQRSKPQDSQQKRRAGIFPVLLLVGGFLLVMTLIVYGYSEYLESEDRKNQVIPLITGTAIQGLGITLPEPRETMVLPQVSQSQTPSATVTPTLTITITTTSTSFSTQPPKIATHTQRPTDPPSPTNTPTPSTSPSPTNTATPTTPPSPTNTLTPAPTMSPTPTPTPTTITPTAAITPSPTPET
jgi:hypothetical protein